MVALNFHKQFANDVEAGRKVNSIRKTKRCKPGDILQLYTGQRTKYCRKLCEGICVDVVPVDITPEVLYVGQKKIINQNGKDKFAEKVGFGSYDEACDFYEDYHGLPFSGYLHTWQLKEPQ